MGEWNWEALLGAEPPERTTTQDPLNEAVEAVLTIRLRESLSGEAEGVRRWVGTLHVPAEQALANLQPTFTRAGYTALVQEAEQGEVAILATPGVIEPAPSRLWVALTLFVLTVVSTVITGAASGNEQCQLVWKWGEGLMYSGSLLGILLAHELGHFLAARRLGIGVSYPFFIPLPFLGFGTMGAFIQMKEPPTDRRALFTIAVAGPLAGLVVAIPLTLLGLSLSTVQPFPTTCGYFLEGNNLLYAAMKLWLFGEWLPSNGRDVLLHPIAWASWAGLLVTAFNLLPAGQLDGGHVVFALLGRRRAQLVTMGVVALLVLMGFVWQGWWLWALMIGLFSSRHAPLLNDVTPLTPRQRVVGLVVLLLFILLFTPTPLTAIPN